MITARQPVVTYHGVKIYLVTSDYPRCRELVIVAEDFASEEVSEDGHLRRMSLVLDERNVAELRELFTPADEPLEVWKARVVSEACARNSVTVADLLRPAMKKQRKVIRARAQAVRVLVTRMPYEPAGVAVGILNHTSVGYWITGAGKDKHR